MGSGTTDIRTLAPVQGAEPRHRRVAMGSLWPCFATSRCGRRTSNSVGRMRARGQSHWGCRTVEIGLTAQCQLCERVWAVREARHRLYESPGPARAPQPWVLAHTDKIRSRPGLTGAPGHGFWLTDTVSHPDSHGCTFSPPEGSFSLPPPPLWDSAGGNKGVGRANSPLP